MYHNSRFDVEYESKRILYHCTDATPHGKKYGHESNNKSWEKNGCPCGTKVNHIGRLLGYYGIKYNLIDATESNLEDMKNIFKSSFGQRYKGTIKVKQTHKNKPGKYIKEKYEEEVEQDVYEDEPYEEEVEEDVYRDETYYEWISKEAYETEQILAKREE